MFIDLKNMKAMVFLLSSVVVASATELTFDIGTVANAQVIDQDYGDRVTNFTVGSFSYGSAGGFTPNVEVAYGALDPKLWTTGYGSLTNVLYDEIDNTGFITVSLSADSGYMVELQSFQLADFSASDSVVGLISVDSATDNLYSVSDSIVSSSTFTDYDFTSSPLVANSLEITIDARNLGGGSDNIGIDNIVFSQVAVPEPSTAILSLLSLVGLLRRRR